MTLANVPMPNTMVYIMRVESGPLEGWQFGAETRRFNNPTGYQFQLKSDNHAATDSSRLAAVDWVYLISEAVYRRIEVPYDRKLLGRILGPFSEIDVSAWQTQWHAAMDEALLIAPDIPRALTTRMQTALSMQTGLAGQQEGRHHVASFFGG